MPTKEKENNIISMETTENEVTQNIDISTAEKQEIENEVISSIEENITQEVTLQNDVLETPLDDVLETTLDNALKVEKVEMVDTIQDETPEVTPKKVRKVKVTEAISNQAQIEAEVEVDEDAKTIAEDTTAIQSNTVEQEIEALQALEIEAQQIDFSQYTKHDFVALLEKTHLGLQAENVALADFKKADLTLKEAKPLIDQIRNSERKEAFEKFKAENETEEGFEYKTDEVVAKFDELYKKIKELKQSHFGDQEKQKENNFKTKTELINKLRELADNEDGKPNVIKENLVTLRKLQQDWKDAGNVHSPHNNTLWQTYHALVDRFYSNRSIYFELLDLDRKKNLNQKVELCSKVEALAETAKDQEVTNKIIADANAIFEEFKHVGPAAKDANELLWQRFKGAMDVLYEKRREQLDGLKGQFEATYEEKLKIVESLELFTSFNSDSINEWNEQTKAVGILQDQWNGIKGAMPKEKGRDLSKKFWDGVKQFFRNKGEFFKALEAKRDENLKAKEALCEQAEAFTASEEDSAANTQAVIKLQEEWRKIGHVPEKLRNKIYDRFKAACDGYFNKKRQKYSESDKEFDENLTKKSALCDAIEKEANAGNSDTAKLADFKKDWNSIGFVPRKEMQNIQKRYINAINKYVGSLGKLSDNDKESLTIKEGGDRKPSGSRNTGRSNNDRDFAKRENTSGGDNRNKINALENDLATLKNNLEFFAKSKNAEKLRADFEQKIKKGEQELAALKSQK